MGIGVTYTAYLLLAVAMFWLLCLRIGWKGVVAVAIPIAGLWYYISQLNPMTPVLRSPMLAAHVSVIMVSYLLLVYILITSIIALCSKRLISLEFVIIISGSFPFGGRYIHRSRMDQYFVGALLGWGCKRDMGTNYPVDLLSTIA